MKARLTPLNFVSAALMVLLVYPLVFSKESGVSFTMMILLILVCSVSDILFRTFLRDLKRIWIVEMLFVIFAVAVLLILGKASVLN
ncbi:hypothetical protein DDR33_13260 [Pararcticibacter amylolyticus]|uniref:Uncharacterized protein n=1 Tax=Pararcticibacter amylolyticus TaxID=2173175 RepID=A0A2U2PFL8_9SPHI|nr:hypothetical protein DDR33_13260 [Pararcticibacter amylolyticus]